MKIKTLYSALFIALSVALTACTDSDDETNGNGNPPAGATPSAEFKPNSLANEPYAEDAIRVVAEDSYAPFYSLELMSDGYYLLNYTRPYYAYAASVSVTAKEDGTLSVFKKRGDKRLRTRSTTKANGTEVFDDGSEYGQFEKLGNKQYRLSNGMTVDLLNATNSTSTISYRTPNGVTSTVYVNVSEPLAGDATRSLCRTWDFNSEELWMYFNGAYVAHGKQTQTNGKVDTYFKAIGGDLLDIKKEDFFDDPDEMCYKVVFTTSGTYICFYLDGYSEVSRWAWRDKSQGTLHYQDYEGNEDYDSDWEGYVTIRFAGSQMRVYEDYTEWEDDMRSRMVVVSTLTAKNR